MRTTLVRAEDLALPTKKPVRIKVRQITVATALYPVNRAERSNNAIIWP